MPCREKRSDPQSAALAAIESQAAELCRTGFDLARRGATHAAARKFEQALTKLAEARDAERQDRIHSTALRQARQTLREAAEFEAMAAGDTPVARLVYAHETPRAMGASPEAMAALSRWAAARRYATFAQSQFAEAVGQSRSCSWALYGLAKLAAAEAAGPARSPVRDGRIMALLQAALSADPNNFAAANELGVILAAYGQLPQAKEALLHAARISTHPTTLGNLAQVHAQLGETDLARQVRARSEQVAKAQNIVRTANAGPMVYWVEPKTFAETKER